MKRNAKEKPITDPIKTVTPNIQKFFAILNFEYPKAFNIPSSFL